VTLAGTGTATAAQAAVGPRAAARAVLEKLLTSWLDRKPALRGQAIPGAGPDQYKSLDWAGYVALTGAGVHSATGKWTVPAVTCTSTDSVVGFWVGIDGWASDSVEQVGTAAFCDNGTPSYYSFWQVVPLTGNNLMSGVQPGDQITASVKRTGTTHQLFTLKLTDTTHPAANINAEQSCSPATCYDEDAEWIAEKPASTDYPDLADFGNWTLRAASVDGYSGPGTIGSYGYDDVTMTDSGGTILAQPGTLNAKGDKFTVTWQASDYAGRSSGSWRPR
jgi:hypothetical protein